MKNYMVCLILLLVLAIAVVPVAARPNTALDPAGPQGPDRTPGKPQATPQGTQVAQRSPRGVFTITGTIVAIDPIKKTVTIEVFRGNRLIQPYLGTDVMVGTTERTRFLYKESSTTSAISITFEELEVGNPVSVNGILANDLWTASRITVGASLSCLP